MEKPPTPYPLPLGSHIYFISLGAEAKDEKKKVNIFIYFSLVFLSHACVLVGYCANGMAIWLMTFDK